MRTLSQADRGALFSRSQPVEVSLHVFHVNDEGV